MEVVHPASYQRGGPRERPRRRAPLLVAAFFFVLCAGGLAAMALIGLRDDGAARAGPHSEEARVLAKARFDRLPGKDAQAIVASTGVGADALEKLSAEGAIAANAKIPVVGDVGPPAPSMFVPIGDGRSYLHALDCMTAAIYYEAANEPGDGQRAVAQVVLNRVRHFSYPKTVCGVVFQGAERRTGCQFSFTCDGSLLRNPSTAGWQRARTVARAALSGVVYAQVGLATHYHADYVVPYWASTLLRQKVIGRHIFYRWPGQWGRLASFGGTYARGEADMWANPTMLAKQITAPAGGVDVALVDPAIGTARPVLPLGGVAQPATEPAADESAAARAYLAARAGQGGSGALPPPPVLQARRSVTGGVIMPNTRQPLPGGAGEPEKVAQ